MSVEFCDLKADTGFLPMKTTYSCLPILIFLVIVMGVCILIATLFY